MKRTFKMMISVATVLVCMLALVTVSSAETEGAFNYSVSNGEATITGFDESGTKEVVIPSTLGGYPVTSIGDYAFEGCTGLTSITIPDNVTSIENSAFKGCTGLTSIMIPDSVTSIGCEAFRDCPMLTNITIGSGVTSIADLAFYETAYYNDASNWENGVLYIDNCLIDAKDTLTGAYNIKEGTRVIAGYAFYKRIRLTNITIPDSVTSIGGGAFSGCSALTSITIGSGVTNIEGDSFYDTAYYNDAANWENGVLYIGDCLIGVKGTLSGAYNIKEGTRVIADGAIAGCRTLTSITIPDSVTSIGDRAFYYCSALTSIAIPDNVTSIGDDAFEGCSALTSINVRENNVNYSSIDGNLYNKDVTTLILYAPGKADAHFSIPDSVTSIGDRAFCYCSALTSVTIPDNVTSIGIGAFCQCSALTSITIPDSVTSIGNYAFSGCSGLTSITIGDGVTSIGRRAFEGCSALTEMTLPFIGASREAGGSLRSMLGDYMPPSLRKVTVTDAAMLPGNAFQNCSMLTEINLNEGISSIGDSAFYNCSGLTSVTMPDSVTNIGRRAFEGCSALTEMTLPFIGASREAGGSFRSMLGDYMPSSLWKVTVTDATTLSNSAFSGCGMLTEIKLNEGITSIGDSAFSECSALTSITIPDSVTSIGGGAFSGTAYYNDDSNWENGVLYIGDCLIEAKDTLTGAYNIKEGTRVIAASAFSGCSALTSITIPDGVTSIGDQAFYYCSALKSIIIGSGVTSMGDNVFSGCSEVTYIAIGDGVPSIGNCTSSKVRKLSVPYRLIREFDMRSLPSTLKELTIISGTEIGNDAFSGFEKLIRVELPDGLTKIGDYAFSDCSDLESITIPDSVTSIGEEAFERCYALSEVIYDGTDEEWKKISIARGNEYLTDAYVPKTVPVTEIVLNKTELKLDAGESATLTAKVLPDNATDKTVSWSTSDSGVATVENGVVTAVSAGSAVITAESADGSVTAECAVTVNRVIGADTPVIKAKSARGTAGKTVRVEISVKNNPGMWGLDAVLNYDKSVMTLNDVENGTAFDDNAFTKGNLESDSYILSYENPNIADVTDDGVLAVLIFEIKDTAEKGNYPVTLKYRPGDIVNSEEKMVDFFIVNGDVEVTDVIYGDVTGDGEVNKMDALRLKKYLAGLDVEIDLLAADVTGDGEVNKIDALRLKKYLAGLDVKLGE